MEESNFYCTHFSSAEKELLCSCVLFCHILANFDSTGNLLLSAVSEAESAVSETFTSRENVQNQFGYLISVGKAHLRSQFKLVMLCHKNCNGCSVLVMCYYFLIFFVVVFVYSVPMHTHLEYVYRLSVLFFSIEL